MSTINDFAKKITDYGHSIKLFAIRDGMQTALISSFTPINDATNGQPLSEYLHKVVNSLKPDSIKAVVGKKNGSSTISPKEFEAVISDENDITRIKVESENLFQKNLGTQIQTPAHLPISAANPNDKFVELQMNLLNNELTKETTRANKFENKYETLKDKHDDLKREHETQQSKFELEREKDKIASQNTALSVVKELRPEINGLMGFLGDKVGAKKGIAGAEGDNSQSLGLDPAGKTMAILQMLKELNAETFEMAWELFIRMINVKPDDKEILDAVLEMIREKTSHIDEQLQESNSQLKAR